MTEHLELSVLEQILEQLKIMNLHFEEITDEEFTTEDIE